MSLPRDLPGGREERPGGGQEPDLAPDPAAEPESLVVTVDTGDRIAFLDWGGPGAARGMRSVLPPLVLVHGLLETGWAWTSVARRLRRISQVIAPDLRGHGASESPRTGYDLESLAYDVLTVMTASGIGPDGEGRPAVVAGHGFGALVAGTMAALRPDAVAGLALIDAGWEQLEAATGMAAAEFLRGLDEPPEVLASMDAYLADRRDWDPGSWDADQERAARSAVDEKPQGRVVPVVRRWARAGCVEAMFAYEPEPVLGRYPGPTLIVMAASGGADDETGRERRLALDEQLGARRRAGLPDAETLVFAGAGHHLMRYRPAELAGELAALLETVSQAPRGAARGAG